MSEIEKIVEKYYSYRKEVNELEKKVQKYKEKLEGYMNGQEINNFDTDKYSVSRVNSSMTTVSKKDLPEDIWTRYCKRCKFYKYYIKEK